MYSMAPLSTINALKRELISLNQTPPLLVFNHDKNTLNNLSATDYFSNCILMSIQE